MSQNINETTRHLKFRYISLLYKSSTEDSVKDDFFREIV